MSDFSEKQIHPNSRDCLRIIQLTDTHIFAENAGKLLGLNTRESFEAVLARLMQEEIAPDLILATGDLSQDASEESYQYLLEKLQPLNIPCFWIPGNHDKPEVMQKILNHGNMMFEPHIVAGNWQIVMLDSSVPGKVYGNISEPQLDFLQQRISNNQQRHSLVVMHHQPVAVGSQWLDGLGIKNAPELFNAVASNDKETCFLWGHVHQDFVGEQAGVQLISTPSTCVQFKPGSTEFSAGDEAPGYRYLTLYPDGRVDSVLHRIHDIAFTVDYSIKGY